MTSLSISYFFSKMKSLYRAVYDTLCGVHPRLYPWHFQWLASRSIVSSMQRAARHIRNPGDILDVGCGTSPYRAILPAGCRYTGIDIETGHGKPDIVIQPNAPWPLADHSYDAVLCTQVLEHAEDQELLLSEIKRVLKPDGLLVLSVPFIYNEHGMPWDFRRFTASGLGNLLKNDYELIEVSKSSKAGTTLATLFLNWMDESMSICRWLRVLKPVLLPLWIVLSFFINTIGMVLDFLDQTESLYLDTILVGRRNNGRTNAE